MITGPHSGEIIVQIKTVAAGVNTPNQDFRFNIIPIFLGIRQPERTVGFPNYTSGKLVSIVVDQLTPGARYTFNAIAMNIFGNSTPTNSPAQFAGPGKFSIDIGAAELHFINNFDYFPGSESLSSTTENSDPSPG